ncbi:hypothetical protein C499_10184 [Halogeometricum borinquense DSM 11551]|uniref:Predicted membrane protein (DUF2078) n=1 Tax=Halogeometricum borinquense (strain ATCC 700274 / DSM 11551 / JCM 10706 / KCTC 4070 / PR3) TaxID=469382 RepID=E4NLI4_HALBP|nr:SHOCT domain-containing protein [Halogeometricum borinquense]ADQ66080.1 Predicted membrane protein (DUF2078) [Halogeometricum borinquense DSM 11551]ELY27424.1 hypothetical protein C499_10184 [Halogeometricum borinquense DSM 11551]
MSSPSTDGFDFDEFIRTRPWTFSAVVAGVVSLIALINGEHPVAGFVGTFIITALLTLPYVRLTDFTRAMTEANQLDSPRRANADQHDDALGRLRERYAEGKIDEAEFERRVEQLLRTQDDDTAEAEFVREKSS